MTGLSFIESLGEPERPRARRRGSLVNSSVILSGAKDLRTHETSELQYWSVRKFFASLRMTEKETGR